MAVYKIIALAVLVFIVVAEVESTKKISEREDAPIENRSSIDMYEALNALPKDKQPHWFRNRDNLRPQTYRMRPNNIQ
ncbi:unnamed protein product [Euphydryas editha]|uniref:Uncharacterized protein n=1 Tax=Euphydryas editha TaxID=104508 RepID=A0AAU9U4C8_EUPED|nr:unnamed protein product [Euphydryas editha]